MDSYESLERLDEDKVSREAKEMMDFLASRIIGQNHAIRQIADAYEIFRSDFREPNHPIATLMFLGPSGSGKTHAVEALAEFLFGDQNAMVKVNCAELKHSHEIARLIGAPPGYIGFTDAEDKTSSHPILSNWNIYKHHMEFFHQKYKAEEEEMDVLEAERYKIGQQRAALLKRAHEVRNLIKDLPEKQKNLQNEVDALAGDPNLFADRKKVHRLQGKLKELRKLDDSGDVYGKEFRNVLTVLNEMAGKIKEINEKIEKLRAVFGSGILDWDGEGEVPKNLTGIVLFDELEKADEALHHLLYEILDKGQLVTSNGSEVNLKNCFIFMTGNVASEQIAQMLNDNRLGFKKSRSVFINKEEIGNKIYEAAMEAAGEVFPAPMLGRMDSIEVFRPFNRSEMEQIFDIQLRLLDGDLVKKSINVKVEISPETKNYLVSRSMKHMEWGARLLNQRVRKYIRLKMIRLMITKQLDPGDTLVVWMEGDKMVFSKKATKTAPDV